MDFVRRWLRPCTWIALVGMLGLGAVPALSHAMARAGGGEWTEVCTAGGLKRVAAEGAPADQGGLPATAGAGHCPLCAPGTPAAALPPAPWQTVLTPADVSAESPAVQLPPALAAPWAAAQPRAPPAGR